MGAPHRRLWIDAMDTLARRQRRLMLVATLAWLALALAQALGVACLWAYGYGGLAHWAPYPTLRWLDSVSGIRCGMRGCGWGCWIIDGVRSALPGWCLAALFPMVAVPPRRRAPAREPAITPPPSPYRRPALAVSVTPDEALRARARRQRRCLFAVASVSCLLLRAYPQAVIIGPAPGYVAVNGVALLDLLVAVIVVVAYLVMAARTS